MLDPDPGFRPVRRRDGYLALEDMGLIGDGTTAALVGLDGSIPWLCLPRFDSEPLFCGLLDHARGGHLTVAPDEVIETRQRYEPDTAVLVTELRTPTGVLAVTDALALRSGAVLSDDTPAGDAHARPCVGLAACEREVKRDGTHDPVVEVLVDERLERRPVDLEHLIEPVDRRIGWREHLE